MICLEMPATWDPAFRQRFYARKGRESVIVSAITRFAEYPTNKHLLSIKAAFGGEEEYFVGSNRIVVDDDAFLILNADHAYGSRLLSQTPMGSFSIFFRAGLIGGVRRALSDSLTALLDAPPEDVEPAVEFAEHLHPHDRSVSPVLRYIYGNLRYGMTDELWLDEQLQFLLQRMLRLHCRDVERERSITSARRSTRKELFRRLGLGLAFMHGHYREQIDLESIAAASHLSRFHFLRTFKTAYGVTPSAYLNRHRIRVAERLLATTALTHTAIAHSAGFANRTTLYRRLRSAGLAGRRDSPDTNWVETSRPVDAPIPAMSTSEGLALLSHPPRGWYN